MMNFLSDVFSFVWSSINLVFELLSFKNIFSLFFFFFKFKGFL